MPDFKDRVEPEAIHLHLQWTPQPGGGFKRVGTLSAAGYILDPDLGKIPVQPVRLDEDLSKGAFAGLRDFEKTLMRRVKQAFYDENEARRAPET